MRRPLGKAEPLGRRSRLVVDHPLADGLELLLRGDRVRRQVYSHLVPLSRFNHVVAISVEVAEHDMGRRVVRIATEHTKANLDAFVGVPTHAGQVRLGQFLIDSLVTALGTVTQ